MSSSSTTVGNAWMAAKTAAISARVNRHAPDRFNYSVSQSKSPLTNGTAELEISGSKWRVSLKEHAVPELADTFDFEVLFVCESGELPSASVSVDLDFANWSAENYVLMPSAVYSGNRFLSRRIPYSPKLMLVDDIGPEKPIIVTDIPRLNISAGPSRIQERSGSMATPSVGIHSDKYNAGIWLSTEQGNGFGDYGIGIEENVDRSKATLSITSPLVRELHSYRMCDMSAPSVDTPVDFKAGDELRILFRLHSYESPKLQSLFDEFVNVRKAAKSDPVNTLPFSACFAVQQEKFNRENFVPEHGYYSVGLRQNFLQDWQIGWTGGMISTLPLLFAGSDETRRNVLRNFDWLFPNGISPSGFFWDSGEKGTQWYGGDIRKPHTTNWHLIRKSADAVYFIIKQFILMEKIGLDVKPSWRDGVRGVCDAFVDLWQENQQFGQFVDSLTGKIVVGGSTSAAIAPAALLLAADYYHEPHYREVAAKSAEYFYHNYTLKGLSCGGPGDALQNPDSESWYALIESYVALYDSTGDSKWIVRAGEAARQFSTWVVSYDFTFPPDSLFGRAEIRTTGSVYANTQNKHSAPGLCTASGLGLLKLFRATGERFALDLLHDIAHGIPQYLGHPLKPLGETFIGHMCERVNMTDWEGPERIGETLMMTTWAETSLMLTTIEIPGLYVQPDKSLVVAFDHITTEVISDDEEKLVVQIRNPTSTPAVVRILCETTTESKQPLPECALLAGPVATLAPAEATTLEFLKTATFTS